MAELTEADYAAARAKRLKAKDLSGTDLSEADYAQARAKRLGAVPSAAPEAWEKYGYAKTPAEESGMANFALGVNAAARRQYAGLKGMFTDLTPAEREELAASKAYVEAAPWQATAGEIYGQAVPQIALSKFAPIAGATGLLSRVTGAGAYGAATEPENRGEAALYGAGGQVGGEVLGKTIPYAVNLAKKGYEGLAGMFHAPTAAAQILDKFADVPGRTIPETVERTRTYERLPGLKPTLAMVVPESQRSLLEFENYVRTKFGKTALAEADLYNNQVIRNAIADKALDPKDAALAMEALNAETGPLREKAFDLARQKTSREIASPILRETSAIRTRAGESGLGSPEAQTLASEIERRAFAGPVSYKSVKIGSSNVPDDIPVFARKVDPSNLYAARKRINDILGGAPGGNDELTNAVKANKNTAIGLKNAIDEALNHASSGEWDKYLTTYMEKIKPIEEGKAFQNVLSRFENASRIPGTDIPKITPAALRKAADETYKDVGAATVSKISPESRLLLRDAERAMAAIENAQSGLTATNNSATASRFYEMFRTAPKAVQPVISAGLAAINILTKNKSQEIIVDALQNPENFQAIVDRYNKMNKVPISPAQAKGLQVLLGSVGAGAAQQGRR
jgi:hypothetical protein